MSRYQVRVSPEVDDEKQDDSGSVTAVDVGANDGDE